MSRRKTQPAVLPPHGAPGDVDLSEHRIHRYPHAVGAFFVVDGVRFTLRRSERALGDDLWVPNSPRAYSVYVHPQSDGTFLHVVSGKSFSTLPSKRPLHILMAESVKRRCRDVERMRDEVASYDNEVYSLEIEP